MSAVATRPADRSASIQGETTMSNELPRPGWFLQPESWPYGMPSTNLGLLFPAIPHDPGWDLAHSSPLGPATQPNVEGGLLAPLTKRADPTSQGSSEWSLAPRPSGSNAGILAPLTQTNDVLEQYTPAWLQTALPVYGNATNSVAVAQLTEQPKENILSDQLDPMMQSDWSRLPISAAPSSLPPASTQNANDQCLTASYPDLGSPSLTVQSIPNFLEWNRPAPPNPLALFSKFSIPQLSGNDLEWPRTDLGLSRALSEPSIWRGHQQSVLNPSSGRNAPSPWEASPSTNLSPPTSAATSTAMHEPSNTLLSLSDAGPPTWATWVRYAQIAPRRVASGPSGREPSPPESIRLLLYQNAHRVLRELDPGNRELSSLNSSTWIPEQRDINRLNAEITKLRRGLASSELEPHHAFPRQFKRQFLACGIDPEHYIVYMEKGAHRLLPNGLHTGSDHWNAQWRRFIDTHKNPTADQFFGHLNLMLKRIPWLKP